MRFPGEPRDYRAARDELLEAERELRRQIENVAAPAQNTYNRDYHGETPDGNQMPARFTPDGRGIDWFPQLAYAE